MDIGCGGGVLTHCLSGMYPNAEFYGCDISRTAIKYAKQKVDSKVRFAVINREKFPYKTNFFDVCYCFDVLEHVQNVQSFLSETKRVLKKNGYLFMAIPCEGQPFSITWFMQKIGIGNKLTYKHTGHIHSEFTHEFIRKLLSEQGFTILSLSYCEHIITQLIRFSRFIIPKEILEHLIGSRKAERYYDRSVTKMGVNNGKFDFFMMVRNLWLKTNYLFDKIENIDAQLFRNNELTAWKIFVLCRNIK